MKLGNAFKAFAPTPSPSPTQTLEVEEEEQGQAQEETLTQSEPTLTSEPTPAPTQPTIDIDAIKAQVLAELQAQQKEQSRLAKLSAQEREKEEFEAAKNRLEQEKLELEQAKTLMVVKTDLAQRGLPIEFASFLSKQTPDESYEAIKSFDVAYRAAIEEAVNKRLGQPTAPSVATSATTPTLSIGDFLNLPYDKQIAYKRDNPAGYAAIFNK